MRVARVRFRPNPRLVSEISNAVEIQRFIGKKASAVKYYAWRHFLSMVKHTHPVTPPPYADSFYVRKLMRRGMTIYRVGNNDPVAVLVEFGAHPRGGPTETLGYRPLGAGVDAVAGGAL